MRRIRGLTRTWMAAHHPRLDRGAVRRRRQAGMLPGGPATLTHYPAYVLMAPPRPGSVGRPARRRRRPGRDRGRDRRRHPRRVPARAAGRRAQRGEGTGCVRDRAVRGRGRTNGSCLLCPRRRWVQVRQPVDVALACGVLTATGAILPDRLQGTALLGELALDGRLHPVRGFCACSPPKPSAAGMRDRPAGDAAE
ncbi:hypothetical protein HBB16_08705 [Pseudonocardia sp. MCCB 268]|nr:hypothetical protein [Pseudonocardia cytotoxica]